MSTISTIFQFTELLREQYCDTIATDAALRNYIMQKNIIAAIKTVHPYAISPHKRGGFYTKVNDPRADDPKHRKTILGADEAEIYLKLAEWYGSERHIEKITLNDLYAMWKQFRIDEQTDGNTVRRDENRYQKYFAGTDFFKKKLSSLTYTDWKTFCCQVIAGKTRIDADGIPEEERHITRKEWGSTRCILNGMLNLAIDKGYISRNYLTNMTFTRRLFKKPPHKTAETEVYNTDEAALLTQWCFQKFAETEDVAYLLPPFNLEVGARIGECVALKWKDWRDLRHLEICRSEYKNRDTNAIHVENNTKTNEDRIVLLNKKAIALLSRIKENRQSNEWVFARNNKRLTSRQANYILERFAKENGVPVKSSHKLRKTCGSNLSRKGATARQCANYLGNSEEVFLRCYNFDTSTESEMLKILDKDLSREVS
ncbi:MAG: site-specific integrase [Eubacteriales bacterium]|nr:site-specific integrase [Eubacteriales bacterium]